MTLGKTKTFNPFETWQWQCRSGKSKRNGGDYAIFQPKGIYTQLMLCHFSLTMLATFLDLGDKSPSPPHGTLLKLGELGSCRPVEKLSLALEAMTYVIILSNSQQVEIKFLAEIIYCSDPMMNLLMTFPSKNLDNNPKACSDFCNTAFHP